MDTTTIQNTEKRKATPAYKRGYIIERKCFEKLKQMGFNVYRSAGSHGLADLIAINKNTHEIWLIQVKKDEAPKNLEKLKEKFTDLKSFDSQYNLKTFLFIKVEGRYNFIKL